MLFSAHHPLDLFGLEPEQHGPDGAGDDGEVEPLLDHVFDTQQIDGAKALLEPCGNQSFDSNPSAKIGGGRGCWLVETVPKYSFSFAVVVSRISSRSNGACAHTPM